jgi:hypothetical protein
MSICSSCAAIQAAGASTPSAEALVASAMRNAFASGAVHEVTVTKRSGKTLTMVNDIGTNEGRQIITLSDGSMGEVIAFDSQKKAYFKGNEVGLKNYFEFPASAAAKYAQEWMKAVPSDEAWSNIVGSTTLKSDFVTDLRIVDPVLSATLVTVNGVRAYAISGTGASSADAPATSVKLYVSDTRKSLPLRLVEVAKGVTATVDWSKWGEALTLETPSKFVPLP